MKAIGHRLAFDAVCYVVPVKTFLGISVRGRNLRGSSDISKATKQ